MYTPNTKVSIKLQRLYILQCCDCDNCVYTAFCNILTQHFFSMIIYLNQSWASVFVCILFQLCCFEADHVVMHSHLNINMKP